MHTLVHQVLFCATDLPSEVVGRFWVVILNCPTLLWYFTVFPSLCLQLWLLVANYCHFSNLLLLFMWCVVT